MPAADELADLIESAPDLPWLRHAACAELELDRLDLFFVEAGRTMSREAQQLCRGCPVADQCVRHAYASDVGAGYFGGLSAVKRRALDLDRALDQVASASEVFGR